MTIHTSIDGAVVELSSLPVGIDGAVVELDSLYAGVDGAKVEIFSAGKKVHNPVKSVTVTGTYSQYASNYGAAVTEDGKVVIYTKFTYNTNYEDVYFVDNGMAGDLVYRTYYKGTRGSTGYYYFAVFENVTKNIDVTLDFTSTNSSNDYVTCNISSATASSGRDYKIADVLFSYSSDNDLAPTTYDVAYCENGDIILLSCLFNFTNSIVVLNGYIAVDFTANGLTLIDSKGYSMYIGFSQFSSSENIFCAVITGFEGGEITMHLHETSSKVYVTLTAS